MRSVHEIQHELWSEQLEYLLRNQAGEPGDELSLRVAAGAYAALRQHQVDKRGRCRRCCRLRSGWWPWRRRACTVYQAFSVAMTQPIKMVWAWLEDS